MRPRYKYLTGQFVEHLGLEMFPVHVGRRNLGHICRFDDGGTLLPAGYSSTILPAVRFEGFIYEREPEGSWKLLLESRFL